MSNIILCRQIAALLSTPLQRIFILARCQLISNVPTKLWPPYSTRPQTSKTNFLIINWIFFNLIRKFTGEAGVKWRKCVVYDFQPVFSSMLSNQIRFSISTNLRRSRFSAERVCRLVKTLWMRIVGVALFACGIFLLHSHPFNPLPPVIG